tara:strand:- start:520 stop:1110 length:591 start_codon:yes stop_codon:yes gene_type:complete
MNVQKVLWAVDELELAHEQADAGLQYGVVGEDWFQSINPNRTVPVIEDAGFVVWESNAILRYLAAKYSLDDLMPSDLRQRTTADMWMDWQQATIMPWLGPLFLGLIRTKPEERDQALLTSAAEAVEEALRVLDGHLYKYANVAGDRFTVADMPLGCVAYRWYALDVTHPELPNLRAWYERLCERPAFARHVMTPLV